MSRAETHQHLYLKTPFLFNPRFNFFCKFRSTGFIILKNNTPALNIGLGMAETQKLIEANSFPASDLFLIET